MLKDKLTKKNILIGTVTIIALVLIISGIILLLPNKIEIKPNKNEQNTITLNAVETYAKTRDISLLDKTSTKDDESIILIKNGISVALRDSIFKKYGGVATSKDLLEQSGLNSLIAVSYDSTFKSNNNKLEMSTEYTNGIFLGGTKTEGIITNTEINGYGNYNTGILVNKNAKMDLSQSKITTKFIYSPALKIKGYANLSKNVLLETNGNDSPAFINEGNLKINDSTLTANASKIGIINNGYTTIKNTTLITAGASNKDRFASAIIMTGKKSSLDLIDSSLNINSKMPYYDIASILDLNKTNATINLKNSQFNYGSNKFIAANNSNIKLNLEKETLTGDIQLDDKSKIDINLKDGSILITSLNNNESTITIDENSKLILQGDTHIKELNIKNPNSIITGKYKLYINNELYK